jgi:hypothetical protein
MTGTVPVPGTLTMDSLAATLTRQEQEAFVQVTALTIDTTKVGNLVTFVDQPNQLGALSIVAKGAAGEGTKILSTTVYIASAKTDVDVYRAS